MKRVLTYFLVAATVALLGIGGVLVYRDVQTQRVDEARQGAIDAAGKGLPKLLSYDYRQLDKDLAGAKGLTTGGFQQEFGDLTTRLVAPTAMQQQIVTKTTVSASSVITAETSRVVLLVFLNQVTQTKEAPDPRLEGARVRTTLEQVDGQWLISELTPV
ncbi:twin-arginine translocation pathway signal [Pseudonocardiaceae bacterium YIM PH 21723]|nr:twin-arginine translocation pathway signal [Pseudonocardiaceae bacterium YIM PH 21723]